MEKSRLCMLCCCIYEPFMDLSSAMITKSDLITFCKEMKCDLSELKDDAGNKSAKNWKKGENNIFLGSDLNLDYQKVSVCPDCLRHISATNEVKIEMNEVEGRVRNLQLQLLKALEELKDFVGRFYNKMKNIEEIIQSSDEPYLHCYIGEHLSAERIQEVLIFRQRILNASLDLPKFQQLLDDKTHCNRLTVHKVEENESSTHYTNPADGYRDCESELNDQNYVEVKDERMETPPSSSLLRRSARVVRPVIKEFNEFEYESEGEDREDNVSEAESQFSPDVFPLIKDKESSNSKYKWKQPEGMSEFMGKIANRVLRALNSKGGNDFVKRKKNSKAAKAGAAAPSIPDPRAKYPLKFDVVTQELTVNEIGIIVQENEKLLKCSICDYAVSDVEAKAYCVEGVMRDHIIGRHIGAYKCYLCDTELSKFKYYLAHVHACSLKKYQWKHKSKEEKKQAKKNCSGAPFNTRPCDDESDGDAASEVGSIFSDDADEFQSVKQKRSKGASATVANFKTKILTRVLQNRPKKKPKLRMLNSGVGGDDCGKEKNHLMKGTNDPYPFPDPRTEYPVNYDEKTQTFTVSGIEMLVNENEASLKCSLCDYSISDVEAKGYCVEGVMQDHIIGIHIRGYSCGICHKHFEKWARYNPHMQTHFKHLKLKVQIFECDVCGKPLKSLDSMKSHKWLHMNNEEKDEALKNGMKEPPHNPYSKFKNDCRKFQCACGQAFVSKTALKGHEARMHTVRERVTCPRCGKLLLPGPSMRYHDLTCTKRDTSQVFECLPCQKSYQNKFLLRQHQRFYHCSTGLRKSFLCHQCGKSFGLKRHLVAHKAVHLDDRPFVCKGQGCSKSFKWGKVLRQHEKTCKMCNSNSISNK